MSLNEKKLWLINTKTGDRKEFAALYDGIWKMSYMAEGIDEFMGWCGEIVDFDKNETILKLEVGE